MRFKYAAKTRDGLVTKKSEIEAPDQSSALKELQEMGLIVYSLLPVTVNNNPLRILKDITGISLTDKVRFTETLASMMKAGLPLTRSLEILLSQSTKPKLTTIIQEILGDIEGGAQLSAALERRGDVFAESYTGLVKAGEASGKLSEVLSRLAATMEKERQFRAKVKGALVYPAAIVIVMIGVFVIIMVYVVPQMLQTFLTFDAELPWSTLLLIKISDTLTNQGIYVLIAAIAMIFAIRYYYKTPGGRYIMDAMFLKVPIFGAIIKQSTIVQFTRTISLLIDSGVPIVDSLKIAKNTVNNVLYKDAVERFIEDVKHGYPLSQSIAKESIIPPFVSQMVVVGEETGTVSVRMDSIADYYEGEVDKIVKNMSTLIEPIIMVFLGGGVLFLIMAVILPIYKLTSDFH